MNRIIPIIAVAVLAIGAGAYFFTKGDGNVAIAQTAAETTAEPAVETASDESAMAMETDGIQDMVLGDPDAPITVIEYASYTCPHCANFHTGTYPQLKAEFVDTGKVKFIFREVYFDRFGLWASMIARCGGQERFFGITDLLFKSQSDWTQAGDPVAIADSIRKVGRLAGLGEDDLQACLQDEDNAKALVAWYQDNAAKDDISSTPSFLINGTKYGNMDFAEFKSTLEGLE